MILINKPVEDFGQVNSQQNNWKYSPKQSCLFYSETWFGNNFKPRESYKKKSSTMNPHEPFTQICLLLTFYSFALPFALQITANLCPYFLFIIYDVFLFHFSLFFIFYFWVTNYHKFVGLKQTIYKFTVVWVRSLGMPWLGSRVRASKASKAEMMILNRLSSFQGFLSLLLAKFSSLKL